MRLHVQSAGDGIETWVLDHPRRRNAVHPAMLAEMTRRCASLRGEVVLLRGGEGPAFCAGYDLTALDPSKLTSSDCAPEQPLIDTTRAMHAADATFIATLNGYAIGAGVELACACDLRIGTFNTTFRVPASRLGVVYHPGGVARMRQILGDAGVRRMLLMEESIDADTLSRSGALDELVAPEALDAAGHALARRVLGLSSISVQAHRALLRRGMPRDADDAFDHAFTERYAQWRRQAYAHIRSSTAAKDPPD